MKYNFNEIISRDGTNSLKWGIKPNELPMWVADMDFKTAPEIIEALHKRAEHGIFGYVTIPDEWYNAYIGWWDRRYGFKMERDWLAFSTGVIPAVSSIIRSLTAPGDKIVLASPVYNHFFQVIEANGRFALESKLLYDGNEYHIDLDDLGQKLDDPRASMLLLCNPHNPTGMIWSRETLSNIGELCQYTDTPVLADEVHCDLTEPGRAYIPFASVDECCQDNCVMCVSPTKAFNLAGLQTSAVAIPNPGLRRRVCQGLLNDEVSGAGVFAVEAAIAAYTKGGEWLEELRGYIWENEKFVRDFLQNEVPDISAVPLHATYLMWLDCSKLTAQSGEFAEFLRAETGLWLNAGESYRGDGKNFIRLNIACPRVRLEDGLNRLKKGAEAYCLR